MGNKVFEGINVAEFAWVAVGPQSSRYFADHGATVVKIESHAKLDLLRGAGPFPENRPMRVGSVAYSGHLFQIHVHIIRQGAAEAYSIIKFRDALREDSRLRKQYVECKRQILRSGTTDSLDYCRAKSSFVQQVLRDLVGP